MATAAEDYVKNDAQVKSAKKKLSQLKGDVANLERVKSYNADTKSRYEAAVNAVENAQKELDKAVNSAKDYIKSNPEEFAAKDAAAEAAKKKKEAAEEVVRNKFLKPEEIALVERKKEEAKNKKIQEETAAEQGTGDTGVSIDSVNKDLDNKIKNARQFVFDLSEDERLQLSQTLKDAGFSIEPSTKYTDSLVNFYKSSLQNTKNQNNVNKDIVGYKPVNWDSYISERISSIKNGGTGSETTTKAYRTISDPTEAQATINSVMQEVLGRDATKSELAFLTKQLNNEEKNKATVITDSKGARIQTGGFSPKTFLTNLIQETPVVNKKTGKVSNILSNLNKEFTTKKQSKASLLSQDILGTILANGLGKTVSQDQIATWTKRIENGESVDTIKNDIRQIAKVGMPDNVKKLIDSGIDLGTIYSPYKNAMASVLELNPDSIDLNDPTLRSAIGAQGEMPIYDFQRALRKDARWQYTNNAREDVSNSVSKVLQDFGFMG